MREWLFISDLHLSPQRPKIIQLFERFIDEIAMQADVLYILGDFLEYWIGDDDKVEELETAFSALNRLSSAGKDVYFMHGNRDFLVGKELAHKCNFQLVADPLLVHIQEQPVLLMHGDTLCTDDVDYQRFRQMVRNPEWQQEFLKKSLEERDQIAQSLRTQSKEAISGKADDIMDVNQETVINTMKEHSVNILIHGHTHRPDFHDIDLDGQHAQRIVLGDWYSQGSYLRIRNINKKIELNTFS